MSSHCLEAYGQPVSGMCLQHFLTGVRRADPGNASQYTMLALHSWVTTVQSCCWWEHPGQKPIALNTLRFRITHRVWWKCLMLRPARNRLQRTGWSGWYWTVLPYLWVIYRVLLLVASFEFSFASCALKPNIPELQAWSWKTYYIPNSNELGDTTGFVYVLLLQLTCCKWDSNSIHAIWKHLLLVLVLQNGILWDQLSRHYCTGKSYRNEVLVFKKCYQCNRKGWDLLNATGFVLLQLACRLLLGLCIFSLFSYESLNSSLFFPQQHVQWQHTTVPELWHKNRNKRCNYRWWQLRHAFGNSSEAVQRPFAGKEQPVVLIPITKMNMELVSL